MRVLLVKGAKGVGTTAFVIRLGFGGTVFTGEVMFHGASKLVGNELVGLSGVSPVFSACLDEVCFVLAALEEIVQFIGVTECGCGILDEGGDEKPVSVRVKVF